MDRFLQSNMVAKGVAVLVAVMLWMIVSLDDQVGPNVSQTIGSTTIDNVKLEVLYDEEIYALKELEDTVKVLLSGRRSLLNINTFRTNHRVYVDLSDLGEGRHRVKVLHEGFPSELQVEIVPAWINVDLEKKETRSFPVKIDITGAAKEGFTADTPIVEQEEVHVIAPASVLDTIVTVRGFININKADKAVKKEIALKVYDQHGNELSAEVSPSTIEVEVPIQSPDVVVPWQLHFVNQLPDGISLIDVQSNISEITVYAPLQELDTLQKIEKDIDLSQIEKSGNIQLDVPIQKEWFATYPKQVEVQIKVGPTQERVFSNIPVTVNGLQEGLELEFMEPLNGVSEIKIQGSKERLEQLKPEDIQASIDVQKLQAGEHTLRLQIEIAGNPNFYIVPKAMTTEVNIAAKTVETTVETNEEGQEGE